MGCGLIKFWEYQRPYGSYLYCLLSHPQQLTHIRCLITTPTNKWISLNSPMPIETNLEIESLYVLYLRKIILVWILN